MFARPEDRPDQRLLVILVALTAVRLVFAAEINFLEDEAYYRLWGLYPASAYFDHAPMVGWWIAIGQAIFGDTHIGLRLLSPLSGLIGSLLLWRIASVSFDREIANHSVLIFNAMLLIGIGSVIMTPDVPSVFFWGLALWTLVEWNQSHNHHWWIAFGFAAGFGLLSKYTNGFLGIGILLWLGVSGRWRIAIRAPQFWLAGVIAIALFAPVLIWNNAHDWISFTRQMERLQSQGVTLRYAGEWLAGQFGLLSPVIAVFVAIAFVRIRHVIKDLTSSSALITVTMLPLAAYFASHLFTSRINANWTAPIYVNLAIITAPVLTAFLTDHRSVWRSLARSAVPSGMLLVFLVLLEALYPFLPPDPRNPIAQIRGYEELAREVRAEQVKVDAVAILTSRYQLTALLDYELRGQSEVVQVTERIRFLNQPDPDLNWRTNRFLYVARDKEAKAFITSYRACFDSAEPLRLVERSDRGVSIATYRIWQMNGVNPALLRRGDPRDCD